MVHGVKNLSTTGVADLTCSHMSISYIHSKHEGSIVSLIGLKASWKSQSNLLAITKQNHCSILPVLSPVLFLCTALCFSTCCVSAQLRGGLLLGNQNPEQCSFQHQMMCMWLKPLYSSMLSVGSQYACRSSDSQVSDACKKVCKCISEKHTMLTFAGLSLFYTVEHVV